MKELEKAQYKIIQPFLNEIDFETAYPYSIVESRQHGRIFVDNVESPNTVLFWHYCGFAYLVGDTDNNDFNFNLCRLLSGEFEDNQRRLILHINDNKWNEQIIDIMKNMGNIYSNERYIFRFDKVQHESQKYSVPKCFSVNEINDNILAKLKGKIVPSFSWHTAEEFLQHGKGFCLIDNKNISCTAFSSGIGNRQMDIGVETNEQYRGKGLGTLVAAEMVEYASNNGYEPAWGCDVNNIASATVAKKLGFQRVGVCSVYIKIGSEK